MKSLMRLGAFLLISSYAAVLFVPAIALAQAKPFPTCTITITPSVIAPGGSATIRWQSTNADGGAITNVGNVSASGAKEILPPNTQITTYVGSFTGPGGSANCTASVQISYGTVTGSGNDIVNPNPTPINGSATTIYNTGGASDSGGGTQPALVQCGLGSDAVGATNCQACNLAQLISGLINFAIGLSIPIAAGLFAWAGILYFSSGANPGNKDKAKGIFSNALIGFLIAITAWLVINTLLHALLDGGHSGLTGNNWFTIKCDYGNRPVNGSINSVINSALPGFNSSGGGVYSGSPSGGSSGGACDSGYELSSSGATCYNPTTEDVKDSNFNIDQLSSPGVPNGDIAAAANAYMGTNTSAGPDGGNLACAWAVNNVLQSAGIAPIGGNSVQSMEAALQNGRGTYVQTSDAQPGDIIVWKTDNVSHVGFCESSACTTAISNSSSNAAFTNVSGSTLLGVEGRVYRVNK